MDGAHVVVSSKKQWNVDPAVAALQEEGLIVNGTVSPARKGKGLPELMATLKESDYLKTIT